MFNNLLMNIKSKNDDFRHKTIAYENCCQVILNNKKVLRIPFDEKLTIRCKLEDMHVKIDDVTGVIIPPDIKKIKDYEFENFPNLKNVTLNEGLEDIGKNVFRACNIEEITIPGSVKMIREEAFSYNPLVKLDFSEIPNTYECREIIIKTNKTNNRYITDEPLTYDLYPCWSNLGGIHNAFNFCDLKTIKFPASLRSISGFRSNNGLTEVIFSEGVRDIGGFGWNQVEELVIPSSVVRIHSHFMESSKLKKLTYKERTDQQIKDAAFYIDPSWGSIMHEKGYFMDCFWLKEVIIPPGLIKSMGEEVFNDGVILTVPERWSWPSYICKPYNKE